MTRRHVRHRPDPVALPVPEAPIDPERGGLYTATELYDTTSYADSLDARAYAWSREPKSPERARLRALHDFAIDEALDAWIDQRSIVGVMGGHAALRGDPTYLDAVRLGHELGAKHVVATGGGPGAMEAANLGAFLMSRPWGEVAGVVDRLVGVPTFLPSVQAWVAPALEVVRDVGERPQASSLGVPTWFYGHEPPNVFCDAIAKYFRNATREAILLEICDAGIVFLPGAAGTVQEVFQDACENYYALPGRAAPMVLVGRAYWTELLPVWPLLERLSHGSPMEGHVHLVDTPTDAAELLG
ncbi:LOG family protein [Nocardioides sp. Kera G14]|uniref:LOG family protein n=1 Tax=Nocardioides sp. Kera G14 TaxID=2884264 RepID=UPI001D112EAB|nr:LOG family protein [Nocardioides sp. Kera G14]UDY22610.1 LOG family protein [Nocardioides sp. Kera G14]